MAMSQCCYLAKGAKRPSHTTNMQPFQLSLFTFGTQLSAFGKFVKVICLGLNCRGTQLTLFAFGTQFVSGLNRCLTLTLKILRFRIISHHVHFTRHSFHPTCISPLFKLSNASQINDYCHTISILLLLLIEKRLESYYQLDKQMMLAM